MVGNLAVYTAAY